MNNKVNVLKIKKNNKISVNLISNFFYLKNQKNKKNLYLKLLQNLIVGQQYFYFIEMFLKGLGYKIVFLPNNSLLVDVGLSHFYEIILLDDIFIKIKKNVFCIYSSNKEKLYNFSLVLYNLKPRDIYKGKGFNFVYGISKLKVGKKR